jgi:hypothetical protein
MSNVPRAAEQFGHRVSEGIEQGINSVKRATVGGSKPADKTQETAHHAENRIKETGKEILDGISGGPTNEDTVARTDTTFRKSQA